MPITIQIFSRDHFSDAAWTRRIAHAIGPSAVGVELFQRLARPFDMTEELARRPHLPVGDLNEIAGHSTSSCD